MSFRIDRLPEYFSLTMTGVLTAQDLQLMAVRAAQMEDAEPVILPRLIDMTEVETVTVGFAEVLALATQRRTRQYANPFKCAFLVGTEVQKGYARMYQTLNDNPQFRVKIFHSRPEAEEWLKLPL